MPHRAILRTMLAILAGLALVIPTRAGSATGPAKIYLQRATFDPLEQQRAVTSSLRSAVNSSLVLVQLKAAPDATTMAALQAAGLRPLLYVPDNAFVARAESLAQGSLSEPFIRWSGPFHPAYKVSAEIDPLLKQDGATVVEVHVLATPDADVDGLGAAMTAMGGTILERALEPDGASFHVRLPVAGVQAMLRRDDVLWVEPAVVPRIHNDRVRAITGVDTARQHIGWLTGEGQIVAVTDTGLDIQKDIEAGNNPDFAGRLERAFSDNQMKSSCPGQEWSDRNGHGTHVAGIILGSGARSPAGTSFGGVAPGARIVVQSVSSGGGRLDCLDTSTFLPKAYEAGARIQNASWGSTTNGRYDALARTVDTFLWEHKDHLFIVSAGNDGTDDDRNGVIDPGSIGSPAISKNVVSVGATESDRPPTASGCDNASTPENYCWNRFQKLASVGAPFKNDFISNNAGGMAAFSSRGPTGDGRIKPDIVAPGTNVISAASHHPDATYTDVYGGNLSHFDYAYDSGTSMAAPVVTGLAALIRQWLAHERGIAGPSAALVKALLLNGATNISPGQYGTGATREIPQAWPNTVSGWGRANIVGTVGLDGSTIWLQDERTGLATGTTATYTIDVRQNQPWLRVTLVWTDYPASPFVGKTLVNDLDLEIRAPDGSVMRGNATADFAAAPSCRGSDGFDRCNTVESVEIATPQAGTYTLQVRGQVVPQGPQPFALVARVERASSAVPQGVPVIQLGAGERGSAATLTWGAISSATFYELQQSSRPDFTTDSVTRTTADTSITVINEVGTYYFRVRGCNAGGCGEYSNVVKLVVEVPPHKVFAPLLSKG